MRLEGGVRLLPQHSVVFERFFDIGSVLINAADITKAQQMSKQILHFTFSERCIVIHIHEKDQQDAHFFK